MAITTLDGVVAGCELPQYFIKTNSYGVSTRVGSLFPSLGIPGAAVVSTAGLGGEALTSYPGQIPFTNPPAGQKAYVARLAIAPRSATTVTLCDRVWHNSGFDTTIPTTPQNFTGCPNFDRDVNNAVGVGEGIFVGIEYYSATIVSTVNVNMTYTNSAGVSGRTATANLPNSGGVGLFTPFVLQGSDSGVRSIQSASMAAAAPSATVSFVAYRPITTVGASSDGSATVIDPLTGGLPEIFNDSVLFFVMHSSAPNNPVSGSITFANV